MSTTITISAVEIAQIELSYAHTRIRRSRQILTLADSLLRCGQLLPIVVVPAESSGFVLIDGYQRVEAARRAGIDSLQAQSGRSLSPKPVPAAGHRRCPPVRRLRASRRAARAKEHHGLSQNRIAAQMGRHPSWITRRLALIESCASRD